MMNGRTGETANGQNDSPADSHLRVWNEPVVRFWWLVGIGLTIIGIGYSVRGILDWQAEADLIHHGALVQATISESGGAIPHRVISEDAAWDLQFELNGKKEEITGFPDATNQRHYNGDVIPIHVDPNDPNHWTNRQTPPPLAHELIGLLFILPAIIICALLGLMRVFGFRRIIQSGNTGWARIISLGQSSIAPRSYTARCAWADEHSRTIYSVFIPRRVRPQAGDRVEIAASQKSSLAILVSDRIERKDETKE